MIVNIFVANQLYKFFPTDTLVKVGAGTAFLKDKSTEYSFGGPIAYENNDVILFHGLPKRIEVDGENLVESFQWQHNALLADCCNLKQNKTCIFNEFDFVYEGKKYYDIEDVELLLIAV